jgi:tryptophan-specific transport protein
MTQKPLRPKPSAFGGAMIIAGTAVGAGMLSTPIATSGVWFTGSIILLVYTWFCMFISGLMVLEANVNYPTGTGFHTMVTDLLGKFWNSLNSVSITFVLYILTYAYISGGSSIIANSFSQYSVISQPIAGLIFAVIVAFIVWISTRAVDRANTILIGGMVISFILSIANMFTHVNADILFDSQNQSVQYYPYALAALPYLLASFGYHGNVPGLVKYYNKDVKAVFRSLLYGTLFALVIYLLWQFVIQGNIDRHSFKIIIAKGGNAGDLFAQLDQNNLISQLALHLLTAFGYMALASSFLGVSLGLFDYMADFFKFKDNKSGRLKTALITFLPPTAAALFFPDGFIYAIGYAGLAATVWAVIIPAMMAYAARKRFPDAPYRVAGGTPMVAFIIFFGLLNALAHILATLNVLPVYH